MFERTDCISPKCAVACSLTSRLCECGLCTPPLAELNSAIDHYTRYPRDEFMEDCYNANGFFLSYFKNKVNEDL